ncbi:MAG: hypothetical protein NT033_07600, partial [Candidatus Omnitrophica bacterium]|nr:hypothetical protein [Candidatus Omnitrophota bacterium]
AQTEERAQKSGQPAREIRIDLNKLPKQMLVSFMVSHARAQDSQRLREVFPRLSNNKLVAPHWLSYADILWTGLITGADWDSDEPERGLIDIWMKNGSPTGGDAWEAIRGQVEGFVDKYIQSRPIQELISQESTDVLGPLREDMLQDLKGYCQSQFTQEMRESAVAGTPLFERIIANALLGAIQAHKRINLALAGVAPERLQVAHLFNILGLNTIAIGKLYDKLISGSDDNMDIVPVNIEKDEQLVQDILTRDLEHYQLDGYFDVKRPAESLLEAVNAAIEEFEFRLAEKKNQEELMRIFGRTRQVLGGLLVDATEEKVARAIELLGLNLIDSDDNGIVQIYKEGVREWEAVALRMRPGVKDIVVFLAGNRTISADGQQELQEALWQDLKQYFEEILVGLNLKEVSLTPAPAPEPSSGLPMPTLSEARDESLALNPRGRSPLVIQNSEPAMKLENTEKNRIMPQPAAGSTQPVADRGFEGNVAQWDTSSLVALQNDAATEARAERNEAFRGFIARQAGVPITKEPFSLIDFNKKEATIILLGLRQCAAALVRRDFTLFFSTVKIVFSELFHWLAQYEGPVADARYDKEGNMTGMIYYPRDRVYQSQAISWLGIGALGALISGSTVVFWAAVPFALAAPFVIEWFLNREPDVDGHELAHLYQLHLLEKIRKEKNIPLSAREFQSLFRDALEHGVDTLSSEAPTPKETQIIAQDAISQASKLIPQIFDAAFKLAWKDGKPQAIAQEHLVILQDQKMGPNRSSGLAFRVPEVRLISEGRMQAFSPGHNVIRNGNQVLIVDYYWRDLTDDISLNKDSYNSKLNVLMHEAMADWLERRGVPAEEIPMMLEGLLKNVKGLIRQSDKDRQVAHKELGVDRSMEGMSRRSFLPALALLPVAIKRIIAGESPTAGEDKNAPAALGAFFKDTFTQEIGKISLGNPFQSSLSQEEELVVSRLNREADSIGPELKAVINATVSVLKRGAFIDDVNNYWYQFNASYLLQRGFYVTVQIEDKRPAFNV